MSPRSRFSCFGRRPGRLGWKVSTGFGAARKCFSSNVFKGLVKIRDKLSLKIRDKRERPLTSPRQEGNDIISALMENAKILSRLVTEIGVGANQILAVEKLLADGNTVPFIARYRKEAHGNLDEVQIGKIQDRVK